MGIYIKDMKMPTSCSECTFCGYYGNGEHMCDVTENVIEYGSGLAKRREDCPLVEVPPHGRLIDADELIAKQEEDAEIFMGSTNYGDKVRYDESMNAVANIVNAPTVIPADKDGGT